MPNVTLATSIILSLFLVGGIHLVIRNRLSLTGTLIIWISVLLKCIYVLAVDLFFHSRVLSTDGTRYLKEISGIAQDPWAWNIIRGTGPSNYLASPKMGMSYLYGIISRIFQTQAQFTALALNIFFSTLTAFTVLLLLREIHKNRKYDLTSLLVASFFPSIFFWNALVTRENFVQFLVCSGVYFLVEIFRSRSITALFVFLPIALVTILTRAQVFLVFPIFSLLYLATSLKRANISSSVKGSAIALGGAVILYHLEVFKFIIRQLGSINQMRTTLKEFLFAQSSSSSDFLSKTLQILNYFFKSLFSIPEANYGLFLQLIYSVLYLLLLAGIIWNLVSWKGNSYDSKKIILSLGGTVFLFCLGLAIAGVASQLEFRLRFRASIDPIFIVLAVPFFSRILDKICILSVKLKMQLRKI